MTFDSPAASDPQEDPLPTSEVKPTKAQKPKKPPKPLSPIAQAMKDHLPGKRFRLDYVKRAAKILKADGLEATLAFLTDKDEASPPNFQPPAKCHIVAQSRPFSEWPINRVSAAIQQHIYGLTLAEREAYREAYPDLKIKAQQQAWFEATKTPTYGFESSVQGLGPIFQHSLARYDGVIVKVTNRNEKRLAKREKLISEGREVAEFVPETAINETKEDIVQTGRIVRPGQLLQPPGINPALYCYQQVSPRPFLKGTHEVPAEYQAYDRDPQAVIVNLVPKDRLTIPEGSPPDNRWDRF
jgi:hypothetical protein